MVFNMNDVFQEYFREVSKEVRRGRTGEHTFRSYLKRLVETVQPKLSLSEEPERITHVGTPDFTCYKRSVKIGFVETKDTDINLDRELESEQLEKYSTGGIANIILTNYSRFILYRNKEIRFDLTLFDVDSLKSGRASIGEASINTFKQMLEVFMDYGLPTIKSATELASALSRKAKELKTFAKEQLEEDLQKPESESRSSVFDFYEAFRELIKDAKVEECVDAYAQTLTYGLFLAKIGSDSKLERRTAEVYIPSSIRIIKKIFSNITGDELPSKLSSIVDEIISILNVADIDQILSEFVFEGEHYKDPFIHFYQDFLNEYDPEKRKSLGVYYTPEPVVSFITNSINHLLKSTFGMQLGFAEDSVKVLDFATGTGTFLANSFVLALHEIREAGLTGIVREKIKNHLLKDFYGFEILVSPYVIAHLKLDTLLKKEGYEMESDERVQVYLTNTLDPRETMESLRGFLKELTQETLISNTIKLKKQILVVMGNPPYYVSSSNKSNWIMEKMKDYKKGLEERNIQPLNDDYIKFIRFAQWKIEENSHQGILGLISNNRYLDGVIHREMRRKLMEVFDHIFILNLHGDAKRMVVGRKDENVFDIKQGVAIALFIKNHGIREKKVFYADLFGSREEKFNYLYRTRFDEVRWRELTPRGPLYLFVAREMGGIIKYERNPSLSQIFDIKTSGVKTHRDAFIVSESRNELVDRLNKLKKQELDSTLEQALNCSDSEKQKFVEHLRSMTSFDSEIRDYDYRPFDTKKVFYDTTLITRHREAVMKNFYKPNIGIVCTRLLSGESFKHVFCTEHISDICLLSTKTSESGYVFPLYVYNDITLMGKVQKGISGEAVKKSGKQPNFTREFVNFINEKYEGRKTSPEEILGYIYAVLHSSKYREKYKEFLKTDFPRIPFVDDYTKFKKLAELGDKLIELHLMKGSISRSSVRFEVSGEEEVVEKLEYRDGKVYINDMQYFDGVPKEAWEFMIGGYYVLDHWLKERKGKQLTSEEVEHFIKVVGILSETLKIMGKIDEISLD